MATFNCVGRSTTLGGISQPTSADTLSLEAGVILDLTAGTAKLPLQFFIGAVQVTANVTGTNLNTLTAGPASNADALHTHAAGQAGSLVLPGQTLWATPAVGEVGYISGNNTWAKAQANAVGTARARGVYMGTANTLTVAGKASGLLQAGLNAGIPPAAGQQLYVSPTTAGQLTNIAPQTSGQVEQEFTILLDASGYNNATGSAQPILIAIRMTIPL